MSSWHLGRSSIGFFLDRHDLVTTVTNSFFVLFTGLCDCMWFILNWHGNYHCAVHVNLIFRLIAKCCMMIVLAAVARFSSSAVICRVFFCEAPQTSSFLVKDFCLLCLLHWAVCDEMKLLAEETWPRCSFCCCWR